MYRKIFPIALSLLFTDIAIAEEDTSHVFAGSPHGYSEAEIKSFKGRLPVTTRLKPIFETRSGVEPYISNFSFCDEDGRLYNAKLSFSGTADQISSALQENREAFYEGLDQHALHMEQYLKRHFTQKSAENGPVLRGLFDKAPISATAEGQFIPVTSVSVKTRKFGCHVL